jgi:hypothetical protein
MRGAGKRATIFPRCVCGETPAIMNSESKK